MCIRDRPTPLPTLEPTPEPTPEPTREPPQTVSGVGAVSHYGRTTASGIRFRSSPESAENLIDRIPNTGTVVWVRELVTDKSGADTMWYAVTYKGRKGYILSLIHI